MREREGERGSEREGERGERGSEGEGVRGSGGREREWSKRERE